LAVSALFFDTCFLIDLEREMLRGRSRAHEFLDGHKTAKACISWTVAGEFAEGFGDIRHPSCAALLDLFEVVPMDKDTAGHYAAITGYLRRQNLLIGTNDLWIAAAALAHGLPLVSANTGRFGRVPGLKIVGYT
jgi:predicted nucleic acid-binding protein